MGNSATPGFLQSEFLKGIRNVFYNPDFSADKSVNPEDFPLIINNGSLDGFSIDKQVAETITAYYICLKIKAETFASISTGVYRIKEDRMIRDIGNPLDYMLSIKPNKHQNAYDWWYASQWLEDLHGDSFSKIERDRSGKPGELILFDPNGMQDVRIDKQTNEVFYVYKGDIIPAYDILHFKQNSKNGFKGRSDITMNKETFELSKEHERYAKRTFGKKPPGVMETELALDSDQVDQIAGDFGRTIKAGQLPIAHSGLKYKSFIIPPGDAQYIESRQFTKAEICAIKRIPLSMIQDYSREAGATYNNVGEQKASFYTDVILPGSRMKEMEMVTKLLSRSNHRNMRIKFDHSELMKADPKTMTEVAEKQYRSGLSTRDESRELINYGPSRDGFGDKHIVQTGYVYADQLEDFYEEKKSESKEIKGFKVGELTEGLPQNAN